MSIIIIPASEIDAIKNLDLYSYSEKQAPINYARGTTRTISVYATTGSSSSYGKAYFSAFYNNWQVSQLDYAINPGYPSDGVQIWYNANDEIYHTPLYTSGSGTVTGSWVVSASNGTAALKADATEFKQVGQAVIPITDTDVAYFPTF